MRLISRIAAVVSTVLVLCGTAMAQPTGGPQPPIGPWLYAAPQIYSPAGSCITMPQNVTGGCVAGNSINVSGGYYLNGALLVTIATVSAPLHFSAGTLSLNIDSSLAVTGGNLGINLANPNIFSAVQTVDLGSGTNEPGTQAGTGFAVYGADGATARFSATVFGTSAPSFDGHASLGTRLSPSAVTSGTVLVQVQGKGYDTTSFNGSGGVLHVYAEGTFSSSSHPGAACLATVLSGTVSVVDQMCVHNDGGVTVSASGLAATSMGAGTLNLGGDLYKSGTAAATTINGTPCALFGSCTITAAASLVVGTTTIGGGTPGDIEYNNGGVLGELGTTGSGVVVLANSPIFVTQITTPQIFCGTSPSSACSFFSTSSGSPSGDAIAIRSSEIILRNIGTGLSVVQIGLAATTQGEIVLASPVANTVNLVSASSASGTATFVGGTYNVVGDNVSQILTNKTISGSSNTLSSIANASLTNSTISGVALGGNLLTLTFGPHLSASGSSYNGSTATTIQSDAASANTASTIVARDGSGNFSAGAITAAALATGGCTIGTNGLCVTGTNLFNVPSPSGTASFFIVTANAAGAGNVAHPNSIQIVAADNNFADFYIDSYGSFGSAGSQSYRSVATLRSGRGTLASPSGLIAGDEFARFSTRGYGTTGMSLTVAGISAIAAQNFTDTAQGTFLAFRTTALNTVGGGQVDIPPIGGAFGPSGSLIVGGLQVAASFTGSISGTTLTTSSGTGVAIGQLILGAGVANYTFITGGSGTSWTVTPSQTVGSEAMTSNVYFATQTANDLGSGIVSAQTGLALFGATSGNSLIQAPATGGGTATLFAGSDTIAGKTVANGGTNCAVASGTCLDNITSFSSTGFIKRTGAGTYTFTADPSDVTSVFGRTGAVVATSGDYTVGQVTGAAPLASPTFTGTITGPDSGTWGSGGINGSIIGGTTRAAGSFTTLAANGAANFTGAFQINGNAITWPAAAISVARIDAAQTFNGTQTFQAAGASSTNSSIVASQSTSTSGAENIVSTNDTAAMVFTVSVQNSVAANTSLINIPSTAVIKATGSGSGLYVGTNQGPVVIYQGGTAVATNIAIDVVAPTNIQFPHTPSDSGKTDTAACLDSTTFQLYTGSGTLGVCLGTSSERYKHGISDLSAGLDEIMRLRPVSYYPNEGHGDPNKMLYGFTAEQGITVLPRLAGLDDRGRPNTFDYLGVVPVLVRAMQELKADNDNLRAEVGRLRAGGGL